MRENINLIWSELILEELRRLGVKSFHIAPGRRDAPFCIMAERLGLEVISHFDERALAFHALGASTSGPAVLICTSGSAVANLMPAVVEAFERKAPLILITADRPHERHGVGDWQAIDQVKIFGTFVETSIDLPAPSETISPDFVLSQMQKLIGKGPTHLNLRLREPLMEEIQPVHPDYLKTIESWLNHGEAWSKAPSVQTSKGVVTAGLGAGIEALKLAKSYGWPLFPCITSNLRTVEDAHIIHHFDHLLDGFSCDVCLHVGGKMLSKRWEDFLKQKRPSLFSEGSFNPASLKRIEGVKALPSLDLIKLKERSDSLHRVLIETPIQKVFQSLKGRGLFIGSSLSVRLAQQFAPLVGPVDILSNRGASGIDGAISTACGFARALKKGVVALIGDLTFLYDLNALSLLKDSPYPIHIVVLNNGGGGIFSALPMPTHEKACAFMETPQRASFKKAAEIFDIPYSNDTSGLDINSSCIIELAADTADQIQLLKEPFHVLSGDSL